MTKRCILHCLPPDATVTLNQAAYTGTEGDTTFGDVCVEVLLTGAIQANLIVTLATTTGSAG